MTWALVVERQRTVAGAHGAGLGGRTSRDGAGSERPLRSARRCPSSGCAKAMKQAWARMRLSRSSATSWLSSGAAVSAVVAAGGSAHGFAISARSCGSTLVRAVRCRAGSRAVACRRRTSGGSGGCSSSPCGWGMRSVISGCRRPRGSLRAVPEPVRVAGWVSRGRSSRRGSACSTCRSGPRRSRMHSRGRRWPGPMWRPGPVRLRHPGRCGPGHARRPRWSGR